MALINFRFYSEALGMQTGATIIMPQKSNIGQIGVDNNAKPGPYKCLYLLHYNRISNKWKEFFSCQTDNSRFTYFPVYDFGFSATSSGVPCAIMVPPLSPPSGPISII